MTRSEVSKYCGVTKSAVTRAIQRGKLECSEWGQITREEAQRWNTERKRYGKPSKKIAFHNPENSKPVKAKKAKVEKFEPYEIGEIADVNISTSPHLEGLHQELTTEKLRWETEIKRLKAESDGGKSVNRKTVEEFLKEHYGACRMLAIDPPVDYVRRFWEIAKNEKEEGDFYRLAYEVLKDYGFEMVEKITDALNEVHD